MNSPIISFIVCKNGFGHFKRVLIICREILKKNKNLQINIFCSIQQFKTYKIRHELDEILKSEKVFFNTEVMEHSPVFWPPAKFDFRDYLDFIEKAKCNKQLINSDLIVSDNIVGILELKNNVILMGSFLWHDILSEFSQLNQSCMSLYHLDSEILSKQKSQMICNKDMIMDSVSNDTIPIKCGWFCETVSFKRSSLNYNSQQNILITLGGNLLADIEINKIEQLITSYNDINFFIDQKLSTYFNSNFYKVTEFTFSESEFKDLDIIICRPGVGILTDAVKYKIPVILLKETNKEIKHNAERFMDIGCGIISHSYETLSDGIKLLSEHSLRSKIISNLKSLQLNGHEQAARHILNSINN